MSRIYRFLAVSEHPAARAVRRVRRGVLNFSLPAPRPILVPLLYLFHAVRDVGYFCMRVFVCEPLFKAACKQYGRGVHTDVYIHWIDGKGDIILGDDIVFDGKSAIKFAARYCERPTLRVGSHSGIGFGCELTVGKSITIGEHCRIASQVIIRDSNGHPSDPAARKAGLPPPADEVRPVVIEDNVWIGTRAIISPGVTVGEGSIVAAGSVVVSSIPPYSIVAGNPARRIGSLEAADNASSSKFNGTASTSQAQLAVGDSAHE